MTVSETIAYILFFVSIYFEVFILITYFEVLGKQETGNLKAKSLELGVKTASSVSIIIPCWNEEATITKTIFSLLELDYPKEKLNILIVDDGSTDNTWNVLQEFANNPQIKLLQKGNGGKHTALNHALQFVNTEFVGCLDADSFVHPEALQRIMLHFENKEMMAVTPSIKVHKPKSLLELFQKTEYEWGILLRNLLCHLNALYVTPGPFTIFRRELFNIIGGYRHAHQTEDMELALRMHTHGFKIGNAPDAYVYTVAPKTVRTLYRQRLRWTYGFLKNIIDYKQIFFNPKYGHLGFIVLPTASISIFSSLYLLVNGATTIGKQIFTKIVEINTVGLRFSWPTFEMFYMNTDIIAFIGLISLLMIVVMIFFARKLAEGNSKFSIDMLYFLFLYPFLAPLWASRAIYNVVFARRTNWR